MMKRFLPITSFAMALSVSMPSFAQDIGGGQYDGQVNQGVQNLSQYLRNLGGYLGYNLTQKPSDIEHELIGNLSDVQLASALSVYALIGARPVDSIMKIIAPSSIRGFQAFNQYANAVYVNPPFNTPKTNQGVVSANQLIDQTDYQGDPISQAVLNILGTPNDSYCVSYDGTSYNSNCKLLTQGQVAINGVGKLPNPQEFFAYDTVKTLIPQLNMNSLTGPLVYQTQSQNQSSTSSPTPDNNQDKGLQTRSQAQAAQNFVRNATGSLLRITLPSQQTYDKYYAKAMNLSKNTTVLEQKEAQRTLTHFMAQVRTYAAQMSIAVSNMYFSLAKRLPQNPANAKNATSQALNEFQMATHRLYNPGMSNNKQWLEKINSASSATVQKEIAVLLAEINYQLYLNRQLQERLLLTNSVILINSSGQGRPDGAALDNTN